MFEDFTKKHPFVINPIVWGFLIIGALIGYGAFCR